MPRPPLTRTLATTLLALIALVFASCGEAETSATRDAAPGPGRGGAPEEVTEDLPKVVFLGDSIAAGLHLERPLDESFPALLHARLAEAGLPFELVNAGVSGDTSAGGRARLDWMLSQDPDLLVVELGANDGLRGVEVASVEENLRAIAEGARARGVPVLLLGMRLPPNLGRPYTEGFAAVYEKVGALEGVTLVPFFMKGVAGEPELNHPDGIHPTAEGHRILAATVRPALEAALRALR